MHGCLEEDRTNNGVSTILKYDVIAQTLDSSSCTDRLLKPRKMPKCVVISHYLSKLKSNDTWLLFKTECTIVVIARASSTGSMVLERYLKSLDFAFRNHDGRSLARFLSANASDIPFSNDFVPHLHQVPTVEAPC